MLYMNKWSVGFLAFGNEKLIFLYDCEEVVAVMMW